MYDPVVGRWLSEDPLGFDAGDENLNRYVGNAVTTLTDPTGLEAQPKKLDVDAYGTSRGYLDALQKKDNINRFGTQMIVGYFAEGEGQVGECIFERTVKDYTWYTKNGKKVVDVDEKQHKPDGPETTPAKPKGGVEGSGISQQGNKWFYGDFDAPGYGLPQSELPGGKKAEYRFKIKDSKTGKVVLQIEWTLEIEIDKNGNVTVTPNVGPFVGLQKALKTLDSDSKK